MSSQPLLSILVPTYNRCEWLKRCLNSILPNLCGDEEVLIGNNASSDSTSTLASVYRHPAIKWFNFDTCLEMKFNWDRLLSVARGEWVLILSDDDSLVPGSLQKIKPYLFDARYNFIIGSTIIDKYSYRFSTLARLLDCYYASLNEFLKHTYTINTCLCSKLIRRQLLLQVGGFSASNFSFLCDVDQMHNAIKSIGGIYTTHILISRYSVQLNSLTLTNAELFAQETQKYIEKWILPSIDDEVAKASIGTSVKHHLAIQEYYRWRYKLYTASWDQKILLLPRAWKAVNHQFPLQRLTLVICSLGGLNFFGFVNRLSCKFLPGFRNQYWWSDESPPPLEVWPGLNRI